MDALVKLSGMIWPKRPPDQGFLRHPAYRGRGVSDSGWDGENKTRWTEQQRTRMAAMAVESE